MFKNAVPVSTFDIAFLVQGAMKERARARPQQASIIDKLIEEALLEFTSLTDDKAPPSAGKPVQIKMPGGPKAGPGGYVDVGSWIDEIAGSPGKADDSLRASFPPGLTEGNLAALEEDEEPVRMPEGSGPNMGQLRAPTPVPAQPMAQAPMPPLSSAHGPMGHPGAMPYPAAAMVPGQPKRPGSAMLGVFVALVVVVVAGAAAWFTGLIPHH
jgi:hypothetical protein